MEEKKKSVRKWTGYVVAALLAAFLLYSAGHYLYYGGKIPVVISSFSPVGEIAEPANFTCEFSYDIAQKIQVDKMFDQGPFVFDPPLPGRYKWLSTRSLRFFPEAALRPATSYTVTVNREVCAEENSYLKGKNEFHLSSNPLKVVGVESKFIYEKDKEFEARIECRIDFNLNVEAKELKRHLYLFYDLKIGQKHIPFTLTPGEGQAKRFTLLSEVVKREEDEKLLKLRIGQGLACVEGDLGLSSDYLSALKLASKNELKVDRIYPRQDERNCWIAVEFSSPVDPDLLKEYLTIKPEVKYRIQQDWGRRLSVKGEFEPGRRYDVLIRKGLLGSDGTTMEKDFSTNVQIDDLEPSLSFENKGIYLRRKGQGNIGIKSINIEKITLEIERIFANNLVYLLSNYQPYDYYSNPKNLGKRIISCEIEPESLKNKEVTTVVDIGQYVKGKEGLFRVVVRHTGEYWRRDTKWVMATDLGLLAKRSENDLLVWVNSLKSLKPKEGVEISLISKTNQTLATGTTNKDGLCFIKGLKEKVEDFAPYVITATLGNDLSFLRFDDCQIPTADFDVGGRLHLLSGYEAFLYTDRGVFRPDDTAHIVGIVRGKDTVCPPPFPVRLEIVDPQGQTYKEFSKTLNKNGAIEFELYLPKYVKTGKYTAKLMAAKEEIGRTQFSVEDFIPDRIKVGLTTDKKSYQANEQIKVNTTGKLLFGPPAAGRRVKAEAWIEACPFGPAKFSSYIFGDSQRKFKRLEIDLGTDNLDQEGRKKFLLDLPKGLSPAAGLKGVIQTTVTEEGGRAVSAYTQANIHPYPFYIGLRPVTEGYGQIGEPFQVEYAAVDPSGNEIDTGPFEVKVYRVYWQSILKKDSRGYFRYHSERTEEIVKEFVQPKGSTKISFVPEEYGQYEIVVSAKGTDVASRLSFYASGWGYAPWSMAHPDRIEIDLDRSTYEPGQKAQVQIRAPFAGQLLLCVEREKVYSYQIIQMKDNTARISLPVLDSYRPNVYITGQLIKDSSEAHLKTPQRAFGTVPLNVSLKKKALAVKIKAKEKIRPDSELEVEIKTAPYAEVTLVACDEGILQLTDFKTPNPLLFFYGKKRLSVSSFDIYSLLMPEIAKKSSAGGDMAELEVRKKHLTPVNVKRVEPVCLYSGLVKADRNGKAKIKFKVPKFQGTLRIMAVSFSKDRFGSSQEQVIVRDKIVLTPTFPRFLSAKDKIKIPVSVFNACGKEDEFTVTLKAEGPVNILGPSTRKITLSPEKEGLVEFEAQADNGLGKVSFHLTAKGASEKTEAKVQLPLRPSSPAITKSGMGVITEGKPLTLALPTDWVSGTESCQLLLSSFPEVKFSGSLQYLLTYPHGCIEQTTSRVFPLLYFDQIAKAAEPALFKKKAPEYYLEEGIDKLCSMQLPSGGFSYWPGNSEADEWGSIYAAHFLVEAKRAGYAVPERVLTKMTKWLNAVAKRKYDRKHDLQRQVYALYVLSLEGKPDKEMMNYLKDEKIGQMSLSSRFQLAACFGIAGDEATALSLLPTGVSPQVVERETGGNLNSSVRENAILLDVLSEISPKHPSVPVLVKALTGAADKNNRWYTTQENAFAFLALGKILKKQSGGKFKGKLRFDGAIYKEFSEKGLNLEEKTLLGKKIEIEVAGSGTCYYYWQTSGVRPGVDVEEVDKGITVRRTILDRDGNPLDYRKIPHAQMVVVKIEMEALSKNLKNVIICDMLPAGLEIENPRLQSRETIPWIKESSWQPDYLDIRDDRLLLYVSLAHRQKRTFYYSARAVTCGEFILPPILAECMYDPVYTSVASSGEVKVVR